MKIVNVPGINIQWPWSQLIINELKTVETRTYRLPPKYLGHWMAMVETPGPHKSLNPNKQSQIIALIRFDKPFLYTSRNDWEADYDRHRVLPNDQLFGYKKKTEKWGWPITGVKILKPQLPSCRRGIIFTASLQVSV